MINHWRIHHRQKFIIQLKFIYSEKATKSYEISNLLLTGTTLESGIDVGQRINVGPGKFAKKNKRRALNKRRASEF